MAIQLGAPAAAWAVNDVFASGCEWNSIDAAVDGEAAGTTITVLQGVYNEDVSITDARTRSTDNEAIVTGGWAISSDDITINGFTIQATTARGSRSTRPTAVTTSSTTSSGTTAALG